jgi:hypothetical protein
LFPSTPFVERQFTTRISPTLFLLAPLLAGIALTAISAFRLIEQNPGLIFMLLTQQGGDLKEIGVVDVEGTLTTAPLILIATIWWAYWRSSDLDFRGWKRWLVRFSLSVAVLLAIFAAILILSRNLVMLVACGLAILYVARRITRKNVSFKFVIGVGASIVTCIILLFFTFSFIRGAETWDYLAYNLVGYTIASYNRLAAMVNGTLHYPFAGHGVYLS